MQFNANAGAHMKGRVMWAVINDDGSVANNGTLEPENPSNNLILDQGLNFPSSNLVASLFRYVAIGTGTSTPATTQVELDNEHARTGNTYGPLCGTTWPADGSSPYTVVMKRGWDFPKGSLDSSVDGDYAELGFSPNSSAGTNLFSRTLIKDSGGTTTTVSVASDQILRVSYELDVTVGPSSPTAGSVTVTNLGTLNYTYQLENVHLALSYVTGGGGYEMQYGDADVYEPSNDVSNSFIARLAYSTDSSAAFTGPTNGIDAPSPVSSWSKANGTVTKTNPSLGVFQSSVLMGTGDMNATGIRHLGYGKYSESGTNWVPILRFEMDSGSEFTKANTHELTLEFQTTFTAN